MKIKELINEVGIEDALKHLQNDLFIKVKEYDNFYKLNYDQIFSPKANPLVVECRALLIDKQGCIVSRAFPRFFNYGEQPDITNNFVWENSIHYSKEDGSLISVYWNYIDQRWEIATRGTAFAESQQDFYPTFREAVLEDGFGMTEDEFQNFFNNENFLKYYTYCFEYVSMKNRIVTPYKESGMVLIGCFDITSEYDDEAEANIVDVYNLTELKNHPKVRLPEIYHFKDIEELNDALNNLTDLKEGFVSKDVNGLRVKHKNTLYVKLHQAKGDTGFTAKKISEVVAIGEESEVLRYFPEYSDEFAKYVDSRNSLFKEIKNLWEESRNIETQKEFALAVKDKVFSALMFSMRKGKSFEDVWNEYRLDNKAEMIYNRVNSSE